MENLNLHEPGLNELILIIAGIIIRAIERKKIKRKR